MLPSPEAARILHVLVAREPNLWRNARRCRALLADELSDYPAEQVALRRALSLGVPEEIAASSGSQPAATLIARLSASLQAAEAMRADIAFWAVTAWAGAIGVRAPAAAQRLDNAGPPVEGRAARPITNPAHTPAAVPTRETVNVPAVAAVSVPRNPWPWALVAAPFVVLASVWLLRAANPPQYELNALWVTATTRQTAFLAWYLPPAIVIALVAAWRRRAKRGESSAPGAGPA